jgi:hypothetical protein
MSGLCVGDRVKVVKGGDYIGRVGRVCQIDERSSGYNRFCVRLHGTKTPVWINNGNWLEKVNPLERLAEIE